MAADQTILFFEHQFRSYQELDLTSKDPILDALEQLNAAAGCEILRVERKGLRALGRVGLLRVGRRIFEILPKIDYSSGSAQAEGHTASDNLLAMLSYTSDMPIIIEGETFLDSAPGSWFELLTRLFASSLYGQLLSGSSLEFIQREEALPVLRGRWNLVRQLRRPTSERHVLQVNYEEMTPDSTLNRLFRRVVDDLSEISQDDINRELLAHLRVMLQFASPIRDINEDILAGIRWNRLNERFKPAYTLARMFLEGSTYTIKAGPFAAYAFVFDMDRLFERFVAGFIRRFQKQIFPPEWRSAQMVEQSAGQRIYLAQCEGKPALRVIPDLVFKEWGGAAPVLIADTKYKLLEGEIPDPQDSYQMLAYLVSLGCSRGLLIFPQPAGGKAVRRRLVVESQGLEIFLCTLNLHIPLLVQEPILAELKEILRVAV